MNNTTFIVGALLLYAIANKALKALTGGGEGLTEEDQLLLAERFNVAPLWHWSGLAPFDMDAVLAHYTQGNPAEDVQGVAYVQRRFDVMRSAAEGFREAVGIFDTTESGLVASVLSTQSLWEVYWLNILTMERGLTLTIGQAMEQALDDREWLRVMQHVATLPDYHEPT